MYPHIRFTDTWATAYPSALSPDTDWLGSVAMPSDSPRQRQRAEKELRKMFPANEARLTAERTAR